MMLISHSAFIDPSLKLRLQIHSSTMFNYDSDSDSDGSDINNYWSSVPDGIFAEDNNNNNNDDGDEGVDIRVAGAEHLLPGRRAS